MPDLLDRIKHELSERLRACEAAVRESERLEAALAALNESGSTTSPRRGARRATPGAPSRPPAGQAAKRKRARPGANREAVLRAVSERPGATAGELADASGVQRTVVHNELRRLVESGELIKRKLASGGTGYSPAVDSAATAEAPPAESNRDS